MAETPPELPDPKLYTLVLWNDFLQKEGMTAQVETTLSQALEILKKVDQARQENHFSNIKILISQTPEDHITEEGHVAISFRAFLETPSFLAHRIAHTLSILPKSPSFKTPIDEDPRLRETSQLELKDFIGTKDFKNHTLRFRILDDDLIVPVEKDPELLARIEGNLSDDPIEEIPLTRLLNSIQLQITESLIKDIQFSKEENEHTLTISKGVGSFLIWILLKQRLNLIKNGWIRKPARVLTFIGAFFAIDGAIDGALEASGLDINSSNHQKQAQAEDILLFLTESLEQAKLEVLNSEHFKRTFCMKLGMDMPMAHDLHLFDEEAQWAATTREKLQDHYRKKTDILKTYLEKVESWLDRIARAKKIKDLETGLLSYELPPRTPSHLEQASDAVFAGGVLTVVGEYAYTKLYKMKRLLYSGRIFGGVALSALTINALLGVSAQEPIELAEDQKMKLESELLELQKRLPKLIHTYELLSKKI